jgi:hypothetical protein
MSGCRQCAGRPRMPSGWWLSGDGLPFAFAIRYRHRAASSTAEHRTFNPLVAGSNPARPTRPPAAKMDLWSSLECSPPCQGGGRGFKSRQVRSRPVKTGRDAVAGGGDPSPGTVPGQVAQLVEHTTENRGVGSSILPLTTRNKAGLTCHTAHRLGQAPSTTSREWRRIASRGGGPTAVRRVVQHSLVHGHGSITPVSGSVRSAVQRGRYVCIR